MRAKLLLSAALFFCLPAFAQEVDVTEMSLDDILAMKTAITSKKELTSRESPGIVSVITRDQIANSGARDLMEVLTLFAPGFDFGNEVEGVVGIATRGIWSLEGRVLLMMDGMELNEETFGSTQFGNHYPAEMIERVEVIRGPGSVIYGGYAGLATINMITRSVGKNGYLAAARDAQMSKTYSHRNFTGGVSHKSGDLALDFLTTYGQGNRSERDYADSTGNAVNLSGKHRLDPQQFNLGVKYKGLEFRTVVDKFDTTQINLYGTHDPGNGLKETFDTYNAQLLYTWKLSENLSVVPKYVYRESRAWWLALPDGTYDFAKYSERHRMGVNADWNISPALRLLSGVEYSTLAVKVAPGHPKDSGFNFHEGALRNIFWTVFSELNWSTSFGNLVAGGRYEAPEAFKSSFVPRVGYTKAWDQLHTKLMYSQSYRAPAGILPDRVSMKGDKLSPEIATTVEAEVGYKFNKTSFASLNVYNVKIKDPLVYIPAATGYYANNGKLGTRGFEAEYRYLGSPFELLWNAAYYKRADSDFPAFDVPGHDGSFIGFANFRSNMTGGYKITRQLSVHPSLSYYGKRYAHRLTGEPIHEYDPQLVSNLNFRYQDLFLQGLEASFGVMNLGGASTFIPQGYDNGLAPMPSSSRAYNLMLSYQKSF